MTHKQTGGPAFPQLELHNVTGGVCAQHFGMTLRDYFAAKAMAALLPRYEHSPDFDLCLRAYQVADNMLEERGA
jgi:hypothetical protein